VTRNLQIEKAHDIWMNMKNIWEGKSIPTTTHSSLSKMHMKFLEPALFKHLTVQQRKPLHKVLLM